MLPKTSGREAKKFSFIPEGKSICETTVTKTPEFRVGEAVLAAIEVYGVGSAPARVMEGDGIGGESRPFQYLAASTLAPLDAALSGGIRWFRLGSGGAEKNSGLPDVFRRPDVGSYPTIAAGRCL